MAILNMKIDDIGQTGVRPRIIHIETDNTLAEITAAGYLNDAVKKFGISLYEDDLAAVSSRPTPNSTALTAGIFEVSYSGGNWSLVPSDTKLDLADAFIFVGNGSNVATGVAMSGDATIANTGAVTLANNSVSLENLDSGITPSHIVVYAGQPTTAGGGAAEAITVTGALATDLAFVQMVDDGTNNTTIVNAVVTSNTLTVTFSGDPGADAVINYQLLRAAA